MRWPINLIIEGGLRSQMETFLWLKFCWYFGYVWQILIQNQNLNQKQIEKIRWWDKKACLAVGNSDLWLSSLLCSLPALPKGFLRPTCERIHISVWYVTKGQGSSEVAKALGPKAPGPIAHVIWWASARKTSYVWSVVGCHYTLVILCSWSSSLVMYWGGH